MEESYNFKGEEQKIKTLWETKADFSPQGGNGEKTFSMFLVPPNASGPLHVGNALMIAIQDVLARYHRAKGRRTLWVPGTDHGGYETQVTFERELEQAGKDKSTYKRKELIAALAQFVAGHNETIKRQVNALGASVDWSRFRYTLDEDALASTDAMFKRLVADELVYRQSYMVNYCTSCATVLADIELRETEEVLPRYRISCAVEGSEESLILVMTRPEFLHTVTHVLVHPQDVPHAHLIGRTLRNPITGSEIAVVESKRKFDPKAEEPLEPFCPSYRRYDYEYAIRHDIPAFDVLNWDGSLTGRYAGMKPLEARARVIEELNEQNAIASVEAEHKGPVTWCKKGHMTDTIIRFTWFLDLDNERVPLRKPALDAMRSERLTVYPQWRMKGLTEWIGKMHDWPIARQSEWGIRIPIWYEVTDPGLFMVWFYDKDRVRHHGNLGEFLKSGFSFEDITEGLERVYAAEGVTWTLSPSEERVYLPETDTFDTWFSSGAWSTIVYGRDGSEGLAQFYPSDVLVIGHDLLRLSVARELILSRYLQGTLPFRHVYFHRLITGADGRKMSKSLGNAVTLDHYLEKYGADVTRMGLISQTGSIDDFMLPDELFDNHRSFLDRLWRLGRLCEVIRSHQTSVAIATQSTADERALQSSLTALFVTVGGSVERLRFAEAQQHATSFLAHLERQFNAIHERPDIEASASAAVALFKDYLILLHPFMPFMTESVYRLFLEEKPLAHERWKEARPSHHRRG